MLRVIIIDDEPLGLNTLKVMIERLQMDVHIVAMTTDPDKGVEYIDAHKPDAVFLDISMPKLDGFELLEKVKFRDFELVFTTAHKEHAIRAIKAEAYDYILKPIDAEELRSCLEKLVSKSEPGVNIPRSRSMIELSVSDGIVLIKQQNIVRLEASGSYTLIYMKDRTKQNASKNLKYFEGILDPSIFYRCHQSHIINLHEVTKLHSADGYFALMTDGSKADVGKNYKDILLSKLKQI